jgi:hypothetical protein
MSLDDYEFSFWTEHGGTENYWPKLMVRRHGAQAKTSGLFVPLEPALGGPPDVRGVAAFDVDEELGNELPTAVMVEAYQGNKRVVQTYGPYVEPAT